MIAELWGHLKNDSIALSFFIFVLIFALYLVVIRVHVWRYVNTNSRKPVHYRLFRLYDKTMISNAPSKREKQFYKDTNKITWTFNSITIGAFIIYLYLMLMH